MSTTTETASQIPASSTAGTDTVARGGEAPKTLDQYVAEVGAAEVDDLRTLARPLEGATVEMVNSTAVGGGVAELLTRLLPLMRELGLHARWHVLEGAEGEGMVLSVGGGVSPGMPRANIVAMLEALQEFNASRTNGNGARHG